MSIKYLSYKTNSTFYQIDQYLIFIFRQLRCVNHYSMQCRGRGSINLDDTDFRMTRPHTCVPRPSINNDENDNRTSLLITLRQRATREQTNLRGDSKVCFIIFHEFH